jgi:hypothetical protein
LSIGEGKLSAKRYLLDALFLVCWWTILDKEGFLHVILGIGKEFLQLLLGFFLFQALIYLNPWRSIKAYTLHQVYLVIFE